MKKRLPISAEEYYKLSDRARFRAFTVARLNDGDSLKKAKYLLEKSIEEGGTLSEFLKKTDTELLAELGLAGTNGGWYWENVYRTNVQTAYNTGRAIGFENVKPLALELIGIGDSRQTELCRSLTQPPVRRPYGDEFWQRYWPPLHFSCRTTVRAIYDPVELEEEPITNVPDGIEKHRAKGFGTYPIDSDSWWDELPSMKRRAVAYGIQGEIEKVKKELLNKTKKLASKLYPDETWEEKSKNIFVAKKREPKNKNQKKDFEKEFEMAKIASDNGHVIYMLPEISPGKNPDVIMDGVITEFKEIVGGEKAVGKRFNEARKQGKNIFLNIKSSLTVDDVWRKINGELKGKNITEGIVYVFINNKIHQWNLKDFNK